MKKKKEDQFIRLNNEKKALKLALKSLLGRMNKELLLAKRARHLRGNNVELAWLLGTDNYNLLFDVLYGSMDEVGVINVNGFIIWGLPVYVSYNTKDVVEIIVTGHSLVNEDVILHDSEKFGDFGDEERMDKYISKLPENAKFKRVLSE